MSREPFHFNWSATLTGGTLGAILVALLKPCGDWISSRFAAKATARSLDIQAAAVQVDQGELDARTREIDLHRQELRQEEDDRVFKRMQALLDETTGAQNEQIKRLTETVNRLDRTVESQAQEIAGLKKAKLAEERLRKKQVAERDAEIVGLKSQIEKQETEIRELRQLVDVMSSTDAWEPDRQPQIT